MKYSEYEEKINGVLSNPDTALTEIAPILEELKNDMETFEAVQSEVEELNARVRDLQETNIKLFLSQGGGESEEEEEETEEEKEVEEFFNNLKEEL